MNDDELHSLDFVVNRFCIGPKLSKHNDVCAQLADNTGVLYNKFDVRSSPYYLSRHPESDYNCVVETAGQWTVARCAEDHLTVCQSDHYIETGKRFIPISVATLFTI